MPNSNEAALRDERMIKRITEGLDLNNPNDIRKIYTELQSGAYVFESQTGRDFDDLIYEKYQSLGKEEQSSPLTSKPKKSSISKAKKSKQKTEEKKYGDEINVLVQQELKKREKRRKLIIVLAVIVALGSFGYLGVYNYFQNRTNDDYTELAALKGSQVLSNSVFSNDSAIVHKQDLMMPDVLPDYQTLYAKNNKMIGWLQIEGTKIDYPVMQTTDNEYYLKHNFNQQKDNNGSLFLDCACSAYPRSTNMIIYGHHMSSGNMFGNLQKYAKEEYWKEHPTITFDTIYEYGTYEVMYVFYSKVYDNDDLVFKYYQFIDANSEAEFDYYMSEMKKLSLYDTGVSASFGDSLLTLSTCDHSQTDGRFAVVAKRVR